MKDKLRQLWRWLRKNVLNKDMIWAVLIAELIFWSPVIVCSILALIVDPWWWTAVTAILVFWAGPFTPAVPLQIGLAIIIKKLGERIWKKKK